MVEECPCFAPALIDLAGNTQLFNQPEERTVARVSLAGAGAQLARAVEVSGRSAEALTE